MRTQHVNSSANLAYGRGALRWRGRLPIPPKAHPIVRRLFEAMNEQQTTLREVAERAAIQPGTMSNWRYQCVPTLDLIEAALNTLDLELVVRKRKVP